MVDLGELSGFGMPSINWGGASKFGLIFLIIILISSSLGFITWFLINFLKNNKKAVLFKKIGNEPTMLASYRARCERLGNAGDFLFFIPKIKKVLPNPDMQMGKNEYWFYLREDGEWINFRLGDVDKQMKESKAYYVHEDMRLQRLGIQKNLADRLNKLSFWQKYGNMIITIIYLMVIMVCLIVLFNRMEGVWAASNTMASSITTMAEQVGDVARSIDNLRVNTVGGTKLVTTPVT